MRGEDEAQSGMFSYVTLERRISEYLQGNLGKNDLTEQERLDPQRAVSQRKCKLIERVFGWSKLNRPPCQVKLRGLTRVDWFYRLTIAACNRALARALRAGKILAIVGEPLSRASLPAYRAQLIEPGLSASTINVQLSPRRGGMGCLLRNRPPRSPMSRILFSSKSGWRSGSTAKASELLAVPDQES